MQDFSSFSIGQAAPFSVSWTMFLDLVLAPSPQVTLHFGEHLYNKSSVYVGITYKAPPPLPFHPDKPSWQAFWPSERKKEMTIKRVYTHTPKTGNEQKEPGIFYKGASLRPWGPFLIFAVNWTPSASQGKIVSWFRLPMHLQSSVSSKSLGQAAPPFSGSLTMSFVLFLVPPPQVRLHGVQEDHLSTSQSTPRVSCSSRG